jgi:Glycosyl-4,4'-diaponeurosporenoate acyltransferase
VASPAEHWERKRPFDFWFAPKRWESTKLYERLGVSFIQRYIPTVGETVKRRFVVHRDDVKGNLDTLIYIERLTRRFEATHLALFVLAVAFAAWQLLHDQTNVPVFCIACLAFVIIILWPVILFRSFRLRIMAMIPHMLKAQRSPAVDS